MMDIYREYMCDACQNEENDENPLSYDPKDKDFKCDKGHSESSDQIFRFDEPHELISIIMDLLEEANKNDK